MNARAKLEGGISVANYNFVKIPSKLPKYPEIPDILTFLRHLI
jgi:hypothetical protein